MYTLHLNSDAGYAVLPLILLGAPVSLGGLMAYVTKRQSPTTAKTHSRIRHVHYFTQSTMHLRRGCAVILRESASTRVIHITSGLCFLRQLSLSLSLSLSFSLSLFLSRGCYGMVVHGRWFVYVYKCTRDNRHRAISLHVSLRLALLSLAHPLCLSALALQASLPPLNVCALRLRT